jgi:NADP-reducing hydrogenase subunit HndB
MPSVKSLDDLKKIREEALKKQQLKETSGKTEVIVGMGTVGIAAGLAISAWIPSSRSFRS